VFNTGFEVDHNSAFLIVAVLFNVFVEFFAIINGSVSIIPKNVVFICVDCGSLLSFFFNVFYFFILF
jgi:hypothetical protein